MSNYKIRKLEINDYYKGYMNLLKQLTNASDISYEDFCNHFNKINSDIFVIENNNSIIASGSLLIEKKFIHNMSSVGHIEDIVVSKDYRGNNLGKKLVEYLINIAKKEKCYKIILNCKKELKNFYEKNNFKKNGIQMSIYF